MAFSFASGVSRCTSNCVFPSCASACATCAFGLIHDGLKRPGIDLEKHLVPANQGAFQIILLDEVARDLRLDLRVHITIQRREIFVINGNVSLDDLDDLDVWRGSGRCRNVLVSTSNKQ